MKDFIRNIKKQDLTKKSNKVIVLNKVAEEDKKEDKKEVK